MVTLISATELRDRIEAGEPPTLVDTRPEDSFEEWHIRGATNVPYDPREGVEDEHEKQMQAVDGDGPVATICGKGLTSAAFAFELEQRGVDDVEVVKGGMEDWAAVYEVVPIQSDELVVRQLQRRGTGCLGYLVGSPETGEAIVVDPTRQTDEFQVAASEAGLDVERVIDTHVHADHLTGGPALADALGVPYHLGAEATDRDVAHDFEALADGDVLSVGDREVRVVHAPGHTTEMIALVVDDELLLTGDTLFVESVGRTELQFGDAGAEDAARTLHETLHERILPLADDLRVLPGHVSIADDGTFEAGEPDESVTAMLGELRERLDLLGMDEDDFVSRVVDEAPEKPDDYERVTAINTGRESPDNEHEATELDVGPNDCAA